MNSLFDPPLPSVPLDAWGIAACIALLLAGAAILLVGAIVSDDHLSAGALVRAVLGCLVIGWGEYRIFRAVPPDATTANTIVWACVLLVPVGIAVAMLTAGLLSLTGAGIVVLSGMAAGAGAGMLDRMAEQLAAIPIGFGTLAVLAVMVFFLLKDR